MQLVLSTSATALKIITPGVVPVLTHLACNKLSFLQTSKYKINAMRVDEDPLLVMVFESRLFSLQHILLCPSHLRIKSANRFCVRQSCIYVPRMGQFLHEVIVDYAYNDKLTFLIDMPIDTQCLLRLHDELDLSPDEFLSHLQLNMSRRFLCDAQSVQSAWRSCPLDMISKPEEKFFPQWGRFKNP